MRRGPDFPDFERMREEMERACARFRADMEDLRRFRHGARRERREERRMERCAPGGFWRWWMIFPLVFFVIPALGGRWTQTWDRSWDRSWDHAWSQAGAGIGAGAERLLDSWAGLVSAPFTGFARMFGDAMGMSTESATALLIAAVAVNAAVILLALRAGPRRP